MVENYGYFNLTSMNTAMKMGFLFSMLFPLALTAGAQDKFRFTYHGTCYVTNGTGQFSTQRITEKDWIKTYVATHTITNANPKNLMVIYHVNGDEHGDVLELVDAKTGAFVFPIYGLFFSDEFGRLPLVGTNGLQQKRIDYVYGHISDHSVGSTLTTETITVDRHGHTNRVRIEGQLDYLDLPTGTNKTLRVCTGTFLASNPVHFRP
jgi:hypothetical protein